MALTELRHLSPRSAEGLDRSLQAAQVAEDCADACIDAGDPEMARLVELCRDVADLALLNARLMIRGSGAQSELAGVCADACETCADECSRFDSEHLGWAEQVLRESAEACRAMAGGPPHPEHGASQASDEGSSPWSGYFDES